MLSKTLQRYENKSKSQRLHARIRIDIRCLRLCKDTKIKANHNGEYGSHTHRPVV